MSVVAASVFERVGFGNAFLHPGISRCPPPFARPKAAVNAPPAKHFARFEGAWQSRQRLECGGLSTAFERANQRKIK